jgi:hypothetical protein
MITPEQIPEEVLRALCTSMGCEWVMQDKEDQIIIRRHIAAAINVWPGAWHVDAADFEEKLILPLTQEKP